MHHLSNLVLAFALTTLAQAQNPIPQIVGPPQPMSIPPGTPAFTLTVYGANFVPGTVVNWNGSPRTTTFVSARELQAQILSTDVAANTAGMISVNGYNGEEGILPADFNADGLLDFAFQVGDVTDILIQ